MSKLNNLGLTKYYVDPYLSRTMHYDGYYEEDCGDYTNIHGQGQGCGYNIMTSFYKKTETSYLEYEDLKGQGVSKDIIIDDYCEASATLELHNAYIDNPYYHATGYISHVTTK